MPPQLLDVAPSPSPPLALRPRCGGKRFVELPARDQLSVQVRSLDDLIPDDAFVRVFDAILDVCDFSAFDACHPGGGRPAFEPKFLCKLLLYGQCLSVRSAREVSRRLERDTHFMWLAHELTVDHETLSNFRRDFATPLEDVFQQLAHLGVRLGLARLEHVSLDGTKIAARAAREALDENRIQERLQRVNELISKLMAEAAAVDAAEDARYGKSRGDEIPEALRRAETRRAKLLEALALLSQSEYDHLAPGDPEAPLQKTQDGKRPGYNGQLAVDAEAGFIVGQALVCDQNDTAQFLPLAEQVIENTGQVPGEFAADSGYHSPETLQALAAREADADPEAPALNAYINQRREDKDGHLGHDDFCYDADSDTYTCPEGKALAFRDTKHLGDTDYRRYRAVCSCKDCPRRAECITEKARYRELLVAPHEPLLRAMRQKLATPEGKRALQLRKQTVERTFGTIKAQLGLRQFLLRGLDGAQVEFLLAAMAVNVRKLVHWLGDGGSLEQLQQAATGRAAAVQAATGQTAAQGVNAALFSSSPEAARCALCLLLGALGASRGRRIRSRSRVAARALSPP